jgi:hypothetical protein
MKRIIIALVALLGAAPSYAQSPVPEIPFEGNVNFLKLPPEMNVGEVSGVAVNSRGEVAISPAPGRRSATAPPRRRCSCSTPASSARGRRGLYAWSYAPIRFDRDDNPGPSWLKA